MKNIFLAKGDSDDRMFFEDALRQITIPTQLFYFARMEEYKNFKT